MRSLRLAAALLLAATLPARSAQADEEAPPPGPRYWVDFEAGRVEVDGDLNRLELERHVKIRVERYRLTSEHLTLERSPRGLIVDGGGELAFCPCESPPITLGFSRAIVAPPTDLFVEGPTVRLGGVPVMWLPVLWLRSPDRIGMLPPRLAWRGKDGLLAGTGVHFPLGGKRGPTLETLDVSVSGYLKRGIDTEGLLATEHTTTRVRFDYLKQSLLAVDTRGSAIGKKTEVGAMWHIDAVRGPRGRYATLELEPAARPYDRARAVLGGAFGDFVATVGAEGIAPRGGALDDPGLFGPEVVVGSGFALGPTSSFDLIARGDTLRSRSGTTRSHALERMQLDTGAHAGPLRLGLDLSRGSAVASSEVASSVATWAGARATLSAPVGRAFGSEPDPLLHVVSPVLEGGGRVAAVRLENEAPLEDVALSDQPMLLGLGGVDTSLGRWAARSAAQAFPPWRLHRTE